MKSIPQFYTSHYLPLSRGSSVIVGLTCPIPCVGIGSFVNSSANPNADYHRDEALTSIMIKTTKTILEGELIFVNDSLVDENEQHANEHQECKLLM